jgi:DNA transformation protein and related proteins
MKIKPSRGEMYYIMKPDLSKHINIGKQLESELIKVGIKSFKELKSVGWEQAFLRICAIDPGVCMSKLSAIAGAIDGVRWHDLSVGKKEELREFFEMLKD